MKYSQYLRKVRKVLAGHNISTDTVDTLFLCSINHHLSVTLGEHTNGITLHRAIREALDGYSILSTRLSDTPEGQAHIDKFGYVQSRKTLRMSWITREIKKADAEERT